MCRPQEINRHVYHYLQTIISFCLYYCIIVCCTSIVEHGGVVTMASQSFCGKDAAEFLHLWHTCHKKPSSRDITTRRKLLRQATESFCSLICKANHSQMTLVSTDDMYHSWIAMITISSKYCLWLSICITPKHLSGVFYCRYEGTTSTDALVRIIDDM